MQKQHKNGSDTQTMVVGGVEDKKNCEGKKRQKGAPQAKARTKVAKKGNPSASSKQKVNLTIFV